MAPLTLQATQCELHELWVLVGTGQQHQERSIALLLLLLLLLWWWWW
jgi:hypothetical protein